MAARSNRSSTSEPGGPEPEDSGEYQGPERRKTDAEHTPVRGEIRFDAKGNPVWEARVDMPRRRKDDDTFDLLKCLDVDDLSLEPDDEETDDGGGFEVYRRDDKT